MTTIRGIEDGDLLGNDSEHQPENDLLIRSELRFIERLAIKLGRIANENGRGKRWQTHYMRALATRGFGGPAHFVLSRMDLITYVS